MIIRDCQSVCYLSVNDNDKFKYITVYGEFPIVNILFGDDNVLLE